MNIYGDTCQKDASPLKQRKEITLMTITTENRLFDECNFSDTRQRRSLSSAKKNVQCMRGLVELAGGSGWARAPNSY